MTDHPSDGELASTASTSTTRQVERTEQERTSSQPMHCALPRTEPTLSETRPVVSRRCSAPLATID